MRISDWSSDVCSSALALGEADAVRTIAAHPSTAFFDMVARYLGTVGYHSVTVLIIYGGFAGLMAYHNVLSRYLFSLRVDGILPRGIGITHPRLESPHRPSLLVSGFTDWKSVGEGKSVSLRLALGGRRRM